MLKLVPRTRRYLAAGIAIWVLLGIEIGTYYSHAPYSVLVPVALMCGLGAWLLITLVLLHFDEEAWGFLVVFYPLLLLATLLVGTIVLLMRVFFE
jgi:hypothetical protein